MVRHSIVRRSLLVVAFVIFGHAFNYLLIFIANRTIDATAFGRFYAAWVTLNIIVTPGMVLALFLTRYYTDVFQAHGSAGVFAGVMHAIRTLAPWVAATVIVLEIALYFAGMRISDSVVLIALLPVTAASIFAVELVRAALPSMLRSILFGIVWVVWCFLQCGFGTIGLLLLRSVWAAYAGMCLGNVLTLVALMYLLRQVCGSSSTNAVPAPGHLDLLEVLPFCSAYAGFVLLNNVDILIAYFALNTTQLGVYSAAAVLPKAIVTATQPIAQIILPILIAVKSQAAQMRHAVIRAIGVTAAMGLAALGILWGASSAVCGRGFGIRYCEPNLMIALAMAAVCLAVTRVAITVDLGQKLYWLAHLPLFGCLLFAVVELIARPTTDGLASSYAWTSFWILVAFASLSGARVLWQRPPARQSLS